MKAHVTLTLVAMFCLMSASASAQTTLTPELQAQSMSVAQDYNGLACPELPICSRCNLTKPPGYASGETFYIFKPFKDGVITVVAVEETSDGGYDSSLMWTLVPDATSTTEQGTLFDANGQQACGVSGGALSDSTGAPLLTLDGSVVYLPGGSAASPYLTFSGGDVIEHNATGDTTVLTSSTDLDSASDLVKAAHAAIVSGHCVPSGI